MHLEQCVGRQKDHKTAPTIAPIPAVTAIASALQNVTRIIPLYTFAPPDLAAAAPSKARKKREETETHGINLSLIHI